MDREDKESEGEGEGEGEGGWEEGLGDAPMTPVEREEE